MRTVVPGPCPVCAQETEYLYETDDIPYFSELLIISTRCPSCGYRYVDTQFLKNAEPTRWELQVVSADDLTIRVIRSMNGVISIPELGVTIEPGPACEGFVSNVEGVLVRIEQVVSNLTRWADEEEGRERARVLQEELRIAREGCRTFTLIIDDLTGNSAIMSDRARVSRIEDPDDCRSPGQNG